MSEERGPFAPALTAKVERHRHQPEPGNDGWRWYLRRSPGTIGLTVESKSDLRGFTMFWPNNIGFDARMRLVMRGGLILLLRRMSFIDAPPAPHLFDPKEVD